MKKNTIASKIAAAACAIALVSTPAVALAQPATTTNDTTIVAQSFDFSHDYTDSFYAAINAVGFHDWDVSVTGLNTYYDADGDLVDYIGFDAYGVHYDVEVEYFNASFVCWTSYVL